MESLARWWSVHVACSGRQHQQFHASSAYSAGNQVHHGKPLILIVTGSPCNCQDAVTSCIVCRSLLGPLTQAVDAPPSCHVAVSHSVLGGQGQLWHRTASRRRHPRALLHVLESCSLHWCAAAECAGIWPSSTSSRRHTTGGYGAARDAGESAGLAGHICKH